MSRRRLARVLRTLGVSAFLLLVSALQANANCRASIVGNLSLHDKSTGGTVADPRPLPPGHAVDGIRDGTVAPPPGGFPVSGEGVAERIADLLIYDDAGAAGAGFCFSAGTTITVRINGLLATSTPSSLLSTAYLDLYDSEGEAGLAVASALVTTIYPANQPVSQVSVRILNAGTSVAVAGPSTVLYGSSGGATGSALRIKNLRVDATTVPGNSPTPVTVSVSQGSTTVPTILGFGGPVQTAVATKLVTIGNLQSPRPPALNDIGSGGQNSGQGLRGGVQGFSFVPGFSSSFRVAGGTCQTGYANAAGSCASQVANDIATAATSLIFAVSAIPSGVTVTFPPRLDMTAANGPAGALVWAARPGSTLTNAGAPGALTVIYDTISAGTAPGTQQIETADFADSGTDVNAGNPNCAGPNSSSNCNPYPKIGVMIGKFSGYGTAQLSVALGPTGTSQWAGDDVTADASPRYAGTASPTGGTWPNGGSSNSVFTRLIVPARDFFTVTASRTVMLFPFVSTAGGFNSGLSIVNTCQDTLGSAGNSVYGTFQNSACDQTGAVTFYFFGVDASPNGGDKVQASLSTDVTTGGISVASICRGFDSTGRIAPGRVGACSLSGLLPLIPGAPRGFEGYVIAVTGFNNAHGVAAQFNAAGVPYGTYPALLMDAGSRPVSNETLGQ